MARPEVTDEKKQRNEGANKGRFAGRMIVIVPLAIVLLLALLGAMYYTPMRIWYREARQLRILTEQKAAIEEYNHQLELSLKSLETTEGIRMYAREELGLVEVGDNAVVVMRDGKPLESSHDTRQIEILNIPLKAQPFGAWTPFLDALFQIELPN
ncbi:MAG: hypothetical protein FWD41_04720 [Actinomycetia bacterium]|nr:hypothetical protein [Actinomycetes bacterium]